MDLPAERGAAPAGPPVIGLAGAESSFLSRFSRARLPSAAEPPRRCGGYDGQVGYQSVSETLPEDPPAVRGRPVAVTLRIASAAWALVSLALGIAVHALGDGAHVMAPSAAARSAPPATASRFTGVGVTVLTFVDHSRTVVLDHRREPRTLVVVVRYPELGAVPARAAGPYPLIVFAHGFNVTPATYSDLLADWARAGYVVAAPVFPLENADAPGGPDESDLVNEPADMSFVVTKLLAARARRAVCSAD